MDGRCIHHLRYSLQSVSGTISDLKNNYAHYYLIHFLFTIYYLSSFLSIFFSSAIERIPPISELFNLFQHLYYSTWIYLFLFFKHQWPIYNTQWLLFTLPVWPATITAHEKCLFEAGAVISQQYTLRCIDWQQSVKLASEQ